VQEEIEKIVDVQDLDALPGERLIALVLAPRRLDGLVQKRPQGIIGEDGQILASGLSVTRSSVLRSQ